jgi:hypothetical protein
VAEAYGDNNPRWCDPSYALSTPGYWRRNLAGVSRYDDVLAVLKVVQDHESIHDPDAACNPCDTTALANAMGLEPQEIADRLSDAEKRGRMVTARKTKGDTEPYFDHIRLTANGRAAVAHRSGSSSPS